MTRRWAASLPLVSLALVAPLSIPAVSAADAPPNRASADGPVAERGAFIGDKGSRFEVMAIDPSGDAVVQGAEKSELGSSVYQSADPTRVIMANYENGFFEVWTEVGVNPVASQGYTTYSVEGAVKYVKKVKKVRRNGKTIKKKVYGTRDVQFQSTLGAPNGELGVVVDDGPEICGGSWMNSVRNHSMILPVKCLGEKAVEGTFMLTTDGYDSATGAHVVDQVDLGTISLKYRHGNPDYPSVWNSYNGGDPVADATVTNADRDALASSVERSAEISGWGINFNFDTNSTEMTMQVTEAVDASEGNTRYFAVGKVTYLDRVETITKKNGKTVRKTHYGTRPMYIAYTHADPSGNQGVVVQGSDTDCRGATVTVAKTGKVAFSIPTSCFGSMALFANFRFGAEATDAATGGIVRDAAFPPPINLT